MGSGIGLNQPALAPGVGHGWTRLAEEVARLLPREEIDAVWAFPNIRRDGREWGTAVVARIEGGRRRIYTARYQQVHKRTDDEHPPVSLNPAVWLAPAPDGTAQ
jgi:hypothetical protein